MALITKQIMAKQIIGLRASFSGVKGEGFDHQFSEPLNIQIGRAHV